jgi:tetratricopeptide (TPR) repeat protein
MGTADTLGKVGMRALFIAAAASVSTFIFASDFARAEKPVQWAQLGPQAPSSGSTLEAQYDAAFQDTLRQPANLDVLFKFAGLATQTGDLEGAISALERMLLINPALPRVQLELGVLYYRLGSYEVARTYLEASLKSPALPADVRSRAEQFMADIEKKQSRSQLAGELFMGWRYQSNANLGPATSTVRLFGQVANLNQAAVGTSDWGVVSSAQVRHTYDLGRQDKSAIETYLTAYSNRQFQLSAANVSLLDLTTGPRFQVFQGIFEDISLKPFLTAGYVWVNDTPYYGSYGAGLEAGMLLADRLRNISTFVWRKQNNTDTSYLPTNSQFSGIQFSGTTSFQYQLSDLVTVFFNGSGQRYQTEQTIWQNYTLWGVGGGISLRFADPLFKTALPWSINLSINEQWWSYDAPDPIVDPGTSRLQADTIFNVLLAIPFDERTTFSISGGRFNRAATISNYAFINNSAMFGVSWRF